MDINNDAVFKQFLHLIQQRHPLLKVEQIADYCLLQGPDGPPVAMALSALHKDIWRKKLPIQQQWADDLVQEYHHLAQWIHQTGYRDSSWALLASNWLEYEQQEETARRASEIAINLSNPAQDGWINAAMLYFMDNQRGRALETARKGYALFGGSSLASLLIFLAGEQDLWPEVAATFHQLQHTKTQDITMSSLMFINSAAWKLMRQGRFGEAVPLLEYCLKEQEAFHHLINRAHCFVAESNFEQALDFYKKAKAFSPDIFEKSLTEDYQELRTTIEPEKWKMIFEALGITPKERQIFDPSGIDLFPDNSNF